MNIISSIQLNLLVNQRIMLLVKRRK